MGIPALPSVRRSIDFLGPEAGEYPYRLTNDTVWTVAAGSLFGAGVNPINHFMSDIRNAMYEFRT